jgi:putative ABC transport system permease protein
MQAAWRLAISSLSARRLRTALLSFAVALSAALIVAVACAMSSVTATVEHRVNATIGAAEARVRDIGGDRLPESVLERVRTWPEVLVASPRAEGAAPFHNRSDGSTPTALGIGIEPDSEYSLRPMFVREGRAVRIDGEVVIEQRLADKLDSGVGDLIDVARFGDPVSLKIVGILESRPFDVQIARPEAWMTRATLGRIDARREAPLRVDIRLRDHVDVETFVRAHSDELPEGLILEPTARVTSGLGDAVRANQIGLLIWSVLAFLAAAFIILTGMTTSIAERQRELAITRCIGAARTQIAVAQLLSGGMIGLLGAVIGVPLGIGLAGVAAIVYRDHLPSGLHVPVAWVFGAVTGGALCGLAASVWPAILASRTSPMAAMRSRARRVPSTVVFGLTLVGMALLAAQAGLMRFAPDGQIAYWTYVFAGAPAMFFGYFLLGAGAVVATARVFGPLLSRLLRVPPSLLTESMRATPIRHGFTAGSLMAGLALMTAIWTNGTALMRDWIGGIEFPDAFVHGFRGLDDDARQRIASLPFVEDTCTVTLQRLDTEAFGVRAIRALKSSFVGFEVEPFFRMTTMEWIEGDPETARQRLLEGGAILVAREFMVAHDMHVGDSFPITHRDKSFDFEIVGVVGSPGLDLAAKYFDIGQEYRDQALHAVFGSRDDLITKFGNHAVHFIQIDLDDSISDDDALAAIRGQITGTLLSAGSGREIKASITSIGTNMLTVVSSIAVMAMLIACFGVGNVVVAGIDARRFEMGVLRAVGAGGDLLARLVVAETLVVILAAGVLGTAMGLQASWAGASLYRLLAGLTLSLRPPAVPIAAGWAIMAALALAAAAPAALSLARRKPRELLAATRG